MATRTSWHIILHDSNSRLSINIHHVLLPLLPFALALGTLPFAFLRKDVLQIFRPSIYILRVIRILEWSCVVQIR